MEWNGMYVCMYVYMYQTLWIKLVFYYLFILLLFILPVGDMTQGRVYKEYSEQLQVAIFQIYHIQWYNSEYPGHFSK